MKKILIMLCCWFITTAQAIAPTSSFNVIVITNFFCPYCWDGYKKLPEILQAIAEKKGALEFVPIAWGNASLWPSLVYFTLPPELQMQAANIFYELAQGNGLAMASLAATCEALTTALPEYLFTQCLNAEKQPLALAKIHRAVKLLTYLMENYNVKQLPIFIVEHAGTIVKVVSRDEVADINELIAIVKAVVTRPLA